MLRTEASIIDAVSQALPEWAPCVSAVPVVGGHGSNSWIVETPWGRLLARIATRDVDGSRLANAVAASLLAGSAGVPVQSYLFVDICHTALGGHPFSITPYLDGQDGGAALSSMTAREAATYFEVLGANVARLHQVEGQFFSRAIYSSRPFANWRQAVFARLNALPQQFRALGREIPDEISAATARLRTEVRRLPTDIRPGLVHGDLYPENTIVVDGRFAALLDFEFARWWDPVADFVKLDLLTFKDRPLDRDSFMKGYAQIRALPYELDSRLRVTLGLELVSAIPFFMQWGDSAALRLYASELMVWLND